jgi:hypothetical protein
VIHLGKRLISFKLVNLPLTSFDLLSLAQESHHLLLGSGLLALRVIKSFCNFLQVYFVSSLYKCKKGRNLLGSEHRACPPCCRTPSLGCCLISRGARKQIWSAAFLVRSAADTGAFSLLKTNSFFEAVIASGALLSTDLFLFFLLAFPCSTFLI